MSTLTPNMSLVLPTIGVDSGLTWEQGVNTNSGILDGHNHSVGSGVQINPSGININADFPFNGFNATSLRSTRYNAQLTPISLPADLGCIYVAGLDLYFNDLNGNQVRITSGGSVNATSSGISSGTNTASFSDSTLVVDAASNTPANIQGASILIGNTGVSGSKYITLSPPSSLSNDYNINLPPLPAQTNVMTLDTSGNMNSITYDQVGENMTSVGADAIVGASTVPFANLARRNQATPAGIGQILTFGQNSNPMSLPANTTTGISSGTITTNGGVVKLEFQSGYFNSFLGDMTINVFNNSNLVQTIIFRASSAVNIATTGINFIDFSVLGTPGSYTYSWFAVVGGTSNAVFDTTVVAYEL